MGQQPSSPVGSASRSLSGNQANKVVFNGSPSEYSGPQPAKPGLFSAGEPASVFTGTAGVVAGTGSLIMRRWNGRGGGWRGGPGIAGSRSPGAFSLEQVSAPVLLGETDSCGVVSESSIQAGFENSLEDADFAVAGAENDFHDAQVVVPGSSGAGAGSSCSLQDDFAVVRSTTFGPSGGRGEVNLSGAQLLPGGGLLRTGTSRCDPKRGQREVADLVTMRPSSSPVSSAVGRRWCVEHKLLASFHLQQAGSAMRRVLR